MKTLLLLLVLIGGMASAQLVPPKDSVIVQIRTEWVNVRTIDKFSAKIQEKSPVVCELSEIDERVQDMLESKYLKVKDTLLHFTKAYRLTLREDRRINVLQRVDVFVRQEREKSVNEKMLWLLQNGKSLTNEAFWELAAPLITKPEIQNDSIQ
ncbi:MAG TPA: hypothetical protein PK167_04105 [Prolixibacteraceae bacterium]|nr:hypothetical protein [Prolixibacteraceae bacterium]